MPENDSQPPLEQLVDQIRSDHEASRTARGEVNAADSPEARLALGVWRRADDLAEGVLALAEKEIAEPIGVLARTLWGIDFGTTPPYCPR